MQPSEHYLSHQKNKKETSQYKIWTADCGPQTADWVLKFEMNLCF